MFNLSKSAKISHYESFTTTGAIFTETDRPNLYSQHLKRKKIPTSGYWKKCGREHYLKEKSGQHYRIRLSDGFDGQLSLFSEKKISSYELSTKLLRSDSTGWSTRGTVSLFNYIKNFVHTFYIIHFSMYCLFSISFIVYLLIRNLAIPLTSWEESTPAAYKYLDINI